MIIDVLKVFVSTIKFGIFPLTKKNENWCSICVLKRQYTVINKSKVSNAITIH